MRSSGDLNFTTPLITVRHNAVMFRNAHGPTVHTVLLQALFVLAVAASIVVARWLRRRDASIGLVFPVFIFAAVIEKLLGSLILWWVLLALAIVTWLAGSLFD